MEITWGGKESQVVIFAVKIEEVNHILVKNRKVI